MDERSVVLAGSAIIAVRTTPGISSGRRASAACRGSTPAHDTDHQAFRLDTVGRQARNKTRTASDIENALSGLECRRVDETTHPGVREESHVPFVLLRQRSFALVQRQLLSR